MSDANWTRRAACRDADLALFFGEEGESRQAEMVREAQARAVCARCSVVERCRDLALRNGIAFGVFGGMTAKERRDVPGVKVIRLCSEYLHVLPEGAVRCAPCTNARERAQRAAQRLGVAA